MSEMRRIRVLIVDDHAVVRNGLKTVLRIFDDLEVVGEASNSIIDAKQRKMKVRVSSFDDPRKVVP